MIVFSIIFILIFGYAILEFILNSKAPIEEIEATLIKKKRYTNIDANNVMHSSYVLFFDINGNTKRFTVNYKTYKKNIETQTGTLIYKRKRFIDFIV